MKGDLRCIIMSRYDKQLAKNDVDNTEMKMLFVQIKRVLGLGRGLAPSQVFYIK